MTAIPLMTLLMLILPSVIPIKIPSTKTPARIPVTTSTSPTSSFHTQTTAAAHTPSQTYDYYATCIHGFENTLRTEVASILTLDTASAPWVTETIKMGRSGVAFTGSVSDAYRVLLYSRVALRVLEQVGGEFTCRSDEDLHTEVFNRVDARDLLTDVADPERLLTLSVRTTMPANRKDRIPQGLTHSHFTSLTVKNALMDRFRSDDPDQVGADAIRPSVDVYDADVPLTLALSNAEEGEDERGCR